MEIEYLIYLYLRQQLRMGNSLHQFRKGMGQFKQSMRQSDSFRSIDQRKGDIMIKTFIASVCLSMLTNYYAFRLEQQIQTDYMQYRRTVTNNIA